MRLRLGLSHSKESKFKHNFQDLINPLCNVITVLNLQLIIFFTAPYLLMKEALF